MNLDLLREELTRDEGERNQPYKCTAGFNSIGIGHNLDTKPISKRAIQVIFEDDLADAMAFLDRKLPWWRTLSDARRRVLVNMAFNMDGRLLGFVKALAAMKAGDFEEAARQMESSLWAKQVGNRAVRLCEMMRNG